MFQETLLIGNVCDPGELKYHPSGEAYIVFTVKTTRKFVDFDELTKTETAYWRVSAWRQWAEWAATNLERNTWVRIRGRLSPDEKTGGPRLYRNRRTLEVVASFDLVVKEMQLMGAVIPYPDFQPLDPEEYLEPVQPIKAGGK